MTLWFCVPAFQRFEKARVCLRQLRRTCDALTDEGIEATAVVIGDDENLDTARDLGFGVVERDNDFLGRKFNDGYQLACDPSLNPRPADYVVPIGTDDWVDYRILLDLPDGVLAFRTLCFVSPDAQEMTARFADNIGGVGPRVIPRRLIAAAHYRPCDEDRNKGCDTSTLINLRAASNFNIHYRAIDPRQIVDWKSATTQVTPYTSMRWRRVVDTWTDPFTAVSEFYPAEALSEIQELY